MRVKIPVQGSPLTPIAISEPDAGKGISDSRSATGLFGSHWVFFEAPESHGIASDSRRNGMSHTGKLCA